MPVDEWLGHTSEHMIRARSTHCNSWLALENDDPVKLEGFRQKIPCHLMPEVIVKSVTDNIISDDQLNICHIKHAWEQLSTKFEIKRE